MTATRPADLAGAARGFAAAELTDHRYFDGLPEPPMPQQARLADAGLANWWMPVEYGGPGVSLREGVDIVSELSYGDAGFAFTSYLSILATTMVHLYGEDEVRKPLLTDFAGSGGVCATLASEDAAGSELGRTETTSTRRGGAVIITGDKYFSTNTDLAEFLVVVTRSAESDQDFRAVVVPRDAPGIKVVRRWDVLGMRGSATYEVRLRNVRVPASHVLRGNGIRVLEAGLNASRVLIATTSIGLSRRVRDEAMSYAATKTIKGERLTANNVFAAKLGEIEMQIDLMLNQCRAAAAEFDAIMARPDAADEFLRVGSTRSALAAKMACGQLGWAVASTGSQLFGGLGYTNDHIIGKLTRDLRWTALVEGGEDVMRDLLYSRYVLPGDRRR
ncbi:acyl-CoA dehydrogenase family protein [Actinokineospora guangxiensis]|uniref:Acyl-CoA dehydrogenase family protein n=1 Tax=Actinokineospora guangxiensis TaxID=1490288 RepID=A0ABW0EWB5_9PSEU